MTEEQKFEALQMIKARITVNKDVTAFGNKFWLQLEDSEALENNAFDMLVNRGEFEVLILFKDELQLARK